MSSRLIKDGLLWGVVLWAIGYVLGFIFFAFIPPALLGWVIMPIGIAVTIFVLLKFMRDHAWSYYLALGIIWALLAIILDYFFLVQLLHPADGYYKLDVYLYYGCTLLLPLVVYWFTKGKVAGEN